jgi:Mrp family chromosome partitioning ATPase
VRDGADAAAITGLTPVAHVPPPGDHAPERRRQEEAFRMLRAALRLHDGEAGPIVAVTSAAPGEGKTTVVAGLGRAVARAGRPVVLVEADLRRPGLAALLGAPTPPQGLTAALVGGVPVADLLVEVEPGLRLVPAGALPPNAPELLGSEDGARVLDELRALDALVLLDAAPLLPVADTRELLAHGRHGTVVLVARPGRITRDELARAAALLPPGAPRVLVVSGPASTPRSYDRYLRDAEA